MSYTVRALIEELQCQDPDAEVRLAFQPSWPFEYSIERVASPSDAQLYLYNAEADDDLEPGWYVTTDQYPDDEPVAGPYPTQAEANDARDAKHEERRGLVYIGEGSQLDYLPHAARVALGW